MLSVLPAGGTSLALACLLGLLSPAALWATPLGGSLSTPIVDYNVDGSLDFDASTGTLTVLGTPTLFFADPGATPTLFFSGDVFASVVVDQSGGLVGGVAGDDFVLSGDVDVDGDFTVDFSGTLLTGEALQFDAQDSGSTTDRFALVFDVTGGLLADRFAPGDVGLEVTSESSTFTGSFVDDFTGLAKGRIGAVPEPSAAACVAAVVACGPLVRRRRASGCRAG